MSDHEFDSMLDAFGQDIDRMTTAAKICLAACTTLLDQLSSKERIMIIRALSRVAEAEATEQSR